MADVIVSLGMLATALQDPSIGSGSRLLLRGGFHTEGDLSCTLNNVVILPYPGETPVLKPSSGYRAVFFGSVRNVVWYGIEIDGSNLTHECVKADGSSGLRIVNSSIHHGFTHGILMVGNSSLCEISGCDIHHNGKTHFDHGVYVSPGYAGLVVTVHHNKISQNAAHGFHAFSGVENSQYVVRNNYLEGNLETGVGCYVGKARVFNNILRGNKLYGLIPQYDIADAFFAFNTIIDSGHNNIILNDVYRDPRIVIANNLCVGTGKGVTNETSKAIVEENNLVSVRSDVIDNGSDDVRPSEASAALKGGVYFPDITDDYWDRRRGVPTTIGAWDEGIVNDSPVSEWALNIKGSFGFGNPLPGKGSGGFSEWNL